MAAAKLASTLFLLLSASVLCGAAEIKWPSCGYFRIVTIHETGVIESPNHPNNYGLMDKCIWVFEAPQLFAVSFNFTAVNMDATCHDYVELRDGNHEAKLVDSLCRLSPGSHKVVRSTGKYAWLKFFSDYQDVSTGFRATWSVVYTGVNTTDNTLQNCSSDTQYSCPNRECTSHAYACDNFNDCGCLGAGCDENNCDLLFEITKMEFYLLCCGSGFVIFLIISISCACIDNQRYRPKACRRPAGAYDVSASASTPGCCDRLACCKKKKIEEGKDPYAQMLQMLEESRHPMAVSWYSTSESDDPSSRTHSPSPRPSLVISESAGGGSRRNSLHPPPPPVVYGNTLSPMDVPVQRRGSSTNSSPRAAPTSPVVKTAPAPQAAPAGGVKLVVPQVKIQVHD